MIMIKEKINKSFIFINITSFLGGKHSNVLPLYYSKKCLIFNKKKN